MKVNNKLNVGVIGCGQIAQIMHLPYLSVSDKFQIVALSDISQAKLDKLGKIYNISNENCFTDYKDLLDCKNIDVVLICSVDHYGPALDSLNKGKHIFVEKPLAFNLNQVNEIIEASKNNNKKVHVGYMKYYDDAYKYIKKELFDEENMKYVRVHNLGGNFAMSSTIFDIVSTDDLPTNILEEADKLKNTALMNQLDKDHKENYVDYDYLLGLTSHDTVLLRHLFGNNIEVVSSVKTKDGVFLATLKVNDIYIQWEAGFSMAQNNWDENISFFEKDKSYRIEFPWPYLKNTPTKIYLQTNGKSEFSHVESEISVSKDESYRTQWHDFYYCIKNNEESKTNAQDAYYDIKLISDIINKI